MPGARLRYLAPLLLTICTAVGTADTLHTIALRHRPADEVVPIVAPLLKPTEGISGSGYQLFIRTDPARVREIERLVAAIDVAQRNLTITVRQTREHSGQRARDQVSGEVTVGKSGTDADVRYRGERRAESGQEGHTQMLRVLDGRRAFIRVGQSVPIVQRVLALTGRGQIVATQHLALHQITTGFDVLPRLRGDTVLLEITPRLSAPRTADDTFRFQELQTTVSARLGEWIDLGAITQQASEVHRAILDSARTRTGENATILLKVE